VKYKKGCHKKDYLKQSRNLQKITEPIPGFCGWGLRCFRTLHGVCW